MKNKARTPILAATLLCIFVFTGLADGPTWKWLDFAEAYPMAISEGKHLIINFYSIGCGWCKRMDNSTFTDTTVIRMLEEGFVGSKLNIASNRRIEWKDGQITEREIAVMFAGRGVPYTTFLDTTGQIVAALPGYVDADRFASILEYVGGHWYREFTYQEYLISGKLIETQDNKRDD